MFQDFQQQIFETRKTIRHRHHHKHLYDRCLEALKSEKSTFKKSETRLKKVGFGFDFETDISLRYLFYEMLSTKAREKERRNLLYLKLNQMAGGRIIQYLSNRVDLMADEMSGVKSLETRERKILSQLEKKSVGFIDSQSRNFSRLIFKAAELKADLKEGSSAFELGNKAREQLKELMMKLQEIQEWGLNEWPKDQSTKPDVSNEMFVHAVNAHMILCAFKNELDEFLEGRDLLLHLEAISGFKDMFFNILIVDWFEESKIKVSLFFVRKTLNSLEAMMQGLNSKIAKIESELSITDQELNAIHKKLQHA